MKGTPKSQTSGDVWGFFDTDAHRVFGCLGVITPVFESFFHFLASEKIAVGNSRTLSPRLKVPDKEGEFIENSTCVISFVDGRNPAAPGMYRTL